jgi:hypothetical protein
LPTVVKAPKGATQTVIAHHTHHRQPEVHLAGSLATRERPNDLTLAKLAIKTAI